MSQPAEPAPITGLHKWWIMTLPPRCHHTTSHNPHLRGRRAGMPGRWRRVQQWQQPEADATARAAGSESAAASAQLHCMPRTPGPATCTMAALCAWTRRSPRPTCRPDKNPSVGQIQPAEHILLTSGLRPIHTSLKKNQLMTYY